MSDPEIMDDYDKLFTPEMAVAMRARDAALRDDPNDQISALHDAIQAAKTVWRANQQGGTTDV